jgi:hypothetical protein
MTRDFMEGNRHYGFSKGRRVGADVGRGRG